MPNTPTDARERAREIGDELPWDPGAPCERDWSIVWKALDITDAADYRLAQEMVNCIAAERAEAIADAERRGAEKMRERCAVLSEYHAPTIRLAHRIRSLPLPGDGDKE